MGNPRYVLRNILVPIILAIAIFFLLHALVPSSVVMSSSMEPSLNVKQRILISKVAYHFHEPERGDIITFYPHGNQETVPFIKRIIGLPGESVEIKQGIVYIHNKDGNVLPLDEPYIKEVPSHPF
ncbi:MAG TPA: signal peptidase I, partial [Dehalococcoidia bacterium]|nr:signal peptidase I [Dehalococcoidia bacterium]